MPTEEVEIEANPGIFEGLAKQNLEFHQCIGELVDNAIAASEDEHKFTIEIMMDRQDDDETVVIWVADNSGGMGIDTFSDALQLGTPATTDSRLNEHGFGMKNALATLSGNNGYWKLWTSPDGVDQVHSTEGPFDRRMEINTDDSFPNEDFLPADVSTVIKVPVKLSYLQTVQGRGAPAKDLSKLRQWLIEHLGVSYRGYLGVDPGDPDGSISVWVGGDRQRVPPIPVPIANSNTEYFEVELGGETYEIEYEYGVLDEHRAETLVDGDKTKAYYLGNQSTQGIDIRLGRRTIATNQISTVWKTEGGESRLESHVRFNHFVGELRIPGKVPRGHLTTTNDKTDFNLDDEGWKKIFQVLNENDDFRPQPKARERGEEQLRREWIQKLRDANPGDTVADDRSVWPSGTRVDVYQETSDGRVIIYEIKTGKGSPLNLYQLKMYWDGLVLQGDIPDQGILLVESYDANESMANSINEDLTPPGDEDDYNIIVQEHGERGLD